MYISTKKILNQDKFLVTAKQGNISIAITAKCRENAFQEALKIIHQFLGYKI